MSKHTNNIKKVKNILYILGQCEITVINIYMHDFTCLKQDQWFLINMIGISVLSYLVFFFSPPYKRRTGLHHLLSLNLNIFQSSFFFLSLTVQVKGRQVISSAECQLWYIVILSEWWAPKPLCDLSSRPNTVSLFPFLSLSCSPL